MPKTVYIIDGHSQIFRAYYSPASRGRSVRGRPVGAVYIFTRMLIKMLREHEPDYLVCVLDPKGPTFRNELYPQYKANRGAMPEDLAEQIPEIERMVEAFGIPILKKDGLEADDVIGILASRFEAENYSVRLVSKDKDLKQLLTDRVLLLNADDDSLYGPEDLEDEFGLKPAQIVDLLALAGDTVDNIPGAKGIGPKTAAKLLAEYGTLEALLERADEIKQPKRREALIEFRPHAELSKKLTTILREDSIEFDLDSARLHKPEPERLLPMLREFNFKSVARDLGWESEFSDESAPVVQASTTSRTVASGPRDMFSAPPVEKPAPATVKSEYTLLDEGSLGATAARIKRAGRIGLHCAADESGLVGIALAFAPGDAAYLPLPLEDRGRLLAPLKAVLEDPKIGKVGHDVKRDIRLLLNEGIAVSGVVFDSRVGAYLIDSSREDAKLASLSREFIGRDAASWDVLFGEKLSGKKNKRIELHQAAPEAVMAYAAQFADFGLQLAPVLEAQIAEMGLNDLAQSLEYPLIEVLAAMEQRGIRIDIPYLSDLAVSMAADIAALEKECHKLAGREFKVGSPKQLGEVLFDELGLPEQGKTAKGGGRSTNVSSLEALAGLHELPAKVLEWRHLSKLKSTYVDQLPELADADARVHTSFRQTVATGRLSSKDPNVQNIPVRTELGKGIRKAFIAEYGWQLIAADYSQIELRVLAHISGDEALHDAFKRGVDIHTAVAAGMFGVDEKGVSGEQRNVAKTVNYGVLYGQSAFGLSQLLGIPRGEAAEFIDNYFASYPRVKELQEKVLTECRDRGYVTTLLGRRRYLPEIISRNAMMRNQAERQAFNTVLQGTAADLIKKAMLEAEREIMAKSHPWRMLLQVHDELVFEAPEKMAEACGEFASRIMAGALELDVPLVVDVGIGPNWLEAKA